MQVPPKLTLQMTPGVLSLIKSKLLTLQMKCFHGLLCHVHLIQNIYIVMASISATNLEAKHCQLENSPRQPLKTPSTRNHIPASCTPCFLALPPDLGWAHRATAVATSMAAPAAIRAHALVRPLTYVSGVKYSGAPASTPHSASPACQCNCGFFCMQSTSQAALEAYRGLVSGSPSLMFCP